MNSPLDADFDLDDDDLRMRFDAIAARAEMPVVDPMADLRRGRDARRRRRVTQVGGGLVAAAAVSALVFGNLASSDPDVGGRIANQPGSGASAGPAPFEDSPEITAFLTNFHEVLGAHQLGATGTTGSAVYDGEAITMVSLDLLLPRGVSVAVRAGVSREVLEWKFAEEVRDYRVGDATGERGVFGGARDAYILDQPDGDVVMVVVDGPTGLGPTTKQINALLTGLDVPDSDAGPIDSPEP